MTDTNVFYRRPGHSYPCIDHGEGIYLYDSTGKRYLDGSSGAVVANIGHGRREVAEAMARQAVRVAFAHTMRFTSEAQEELADRLASHVSRPLRYSFFVSGGSEATETAIKLARQYHLERGEPARTKVIARTASYHGNTLGALAASGHLARREPYIPLLSDRFVHLDVPRGPGEGCAETGVPDTCPCLIEARTAMEREDPSTIAAVIMEVVGGSALSGFRPHPGYLPGLQRLCREYGILLILDEVMTGIGRTGRWFALEHEGLQPDMIVLAKGLSGGYAPLGAVVATAQIHETIRNGSGALKHGLTYAGNPVSTAAGVATLRIVEDEGLVANAAQMGEVIAAGLAELAHRHPIIREVRGAGLMHGIVLASRDDHPRGALTAKLADIAFEQGLIVYPGSGSGDSVNGDHLLVAPPLIVTEPQIEELLTLLDQALVELKA